MAIPTHGATPEAGSAHRERLAGWLLVAGCLVPLLKHSLLLDASYVVWPWQLAGLGVGLAESAALATAAGGENLAAWALLPLVGGLIALALPRVPSLRTRGLAAMTTGVALLVLLLLVLVRENAVLGLVVAPPTRGAGTIMLLGIGACALLAASNHTAKTTPPRDVSPALVIAASLIVAVLGLFFLLAASDVWAASSMRLLYVAVITYALLALWRTVRPRAAPVVTAWASTLARAILGWAVIAVVLAQSGSHDRLVVYVIEAGGGTVPVAIGAAKGFLIFAGAGLLLAAGITTALEAGASDSHHRAATRRVTPTRGLVSRSPLVALVGALLASTLAGCSSAPPDLAKAINAVGAMVSRHGLERSAFYAVYPDGTPSDFVAFLFSPLGKAEWVPDDAATPERTGLVSAEDVLAVGGELRPGAVGLVSEAPEPRIHRQVVLRADDERGVVIAAAYEQPGQAPVVVHEWALPRVTLAPGVAEMARENLESGVDAGAE
jgi:hypothetical protein